MKHTFTLTFRGEHVQTWTSVYDVQHVVLTWAKPAASLPTVSLRYKTLVNCVKEAKYRKSLNQWAGQSFIVEVKPGTIEIVDAPAFDVSGKVVA